MTESMRSSGNKYHKYTDEQILWIESHHPNFTMYKDMLKAFEAEFGCKPSVRSIQHKCQNLGLRFPNGDRYKNKHSGRYIPVGSETIRKTGGTGRMMWFVKVDDELLKWGENNSKQIANNWIPKHLKIWRERFGEIPKGYKVVFLNNNSLDCRIENLALVSDKVHMDMVRNNWYVEESVLTETAIKVCELERALK